MVESIETTRQNVTALNVTSTSGAEIAREIRGDYRGEVVTNSSAASKLQDAAEELGMAVAHRADRRTLERRDVRQGQGISLAALSRIADYYEKLPDMPREDELRNLVQLLQSYAELIENGGGSGGSVSSDDILKLLQQFDPDVTHQFAALDIAREYFAATDATSKLQLLLDEVYIQYNSGDTGREVRAGMAASRAAAQIAPTLGTDPAAVREAYRELLRDSKDMGQLFDAFRNFDVLRNFDDVISTFMSVAGQDLASTSSSTDPSYLHALVTELSSLKKMRSIVDMSSALITATDRLLQVGDSPQGGSVDVASAILNFTSNPSAGTSDALGMLSRYANCSAATQVAFANGLRALHGEIPDDVFQSPQARIRQTTALLDVMDRLVAEEERAYATAQ